MEQTPYCKNCWNSLYISGNNGICDKCNITRPLTSTQMRNHKNNMQCKITCSCGGIAYRFKGVTTYECYCCWKIYDEHGVRVMSKSD